MIRFLVGLALFPVAVVNIGCVTRVSPPQSVVDPVAVYIVDYGRHASLLLPIEQPVAGSVERTAMREYSFGDWMYYANSDNSLAKGAAAMLWKTQGTVGRRDIAAIGPAFDEAPSEPTARIQRTLAVEQVYAIVVEREAAMELLNSLDLRFETGSEAMVPVNNPTVGLDFVPDQKHYSLLSHCNHEMRDWLTLLGAEAYGAPVISEFKILRLN